MEKFNVFGMSCAACSARVEKAVSKIEGVEKVSVNLLTNSMIVEGDVSSDIIINAVVQAGYGASLKTAGSEGSGNNSNESNNTGLDSDGEVKKLRNRLIASAIFLAVLMYVAMGHTMWNLPLPENIEGNHVAISLIQLLLATVIMIINQKFFINGFKGVLHRSPNMDTLVALGSGASYIWSVYVLFLMTGEVMRGNSDEAMKHMHDLYFESAAMILVLITVGKMLEAYSKGKTTNAIKSLMELAPKTATLLVDGKEVVVTADKVKKDDIFIVRPGESVAVDGIVLEGNSAIDESALTGESIPVDKSEGDEVYAATINQSGFIKCKAVKVGEDTSLAQIIRMVSDAVATKAPVARIADKVSGIFVPVVILIAVLTTFVWLIIGQEMGYSLARGISVLVISCPCALGLATPVAIMVGNGVGAKNGILFKNSTALENVCKSKIIVLDKTGTITEGKPVVTDIIACDDIDENELLKTAASVEIKSEHPLAKAIVDKADEKKLGLYESSDFENLVGSGVKATVNGKKIICGGIVYICKIISVEQKYVTACEELAKKGKTPLLFVCEDNLLGIIAVADTIKSDSALAIQNMKKMGCKVVMLTGDNENTAKAVGDMAAVDEVIANVMPADKEANIKRLSKQGKVVMVGDGINDAPALTGADVGIAIGAGTSVAIDAADVVLVKSSLMDVVTAIKISKATLRNIKQNLFWAFIYNIIGIPLAAGVFVKLGFTLTPMFGAAAMSLSSFCVVSNALSLNLFKKDECIDETKINGNEKGSIKMTKTMVIEGMMCGHCEARVKKILEEIQGVDSAEVSHEKGTAIVTASDDISDEILKEVVEAQDYKVTSIN